MKYFKRYKLIGKGLYIVITLSICKHIWLHNIETAAWVTLALYFFHLYEKESSKQKTTNIIAENVNIEVKEQK